MEKASPRAWGVSLIGGRGLHEGCKRVQKGFKRLQSGILLVEQPTSEKGKGVLFVCCLFGCLFGTTGFGKREGGVSFCLFVCWFVCLEQLIAEKGGEWRKVPIRPGLLHYPDY